MRNIELPVRKYRFTYVCLVEYSFTQHTLTPQLSELSVLSNQLNFSLPFRYCTNISDYLAKKKIRT